MLVTTFAIAFLLQAIALIVDLRDGTLGEVAPSLTLAERAGHVGGADIRKITLVSVGVAAVALLAARAAARRGRRSACTRAPPRATSAPPACSACARTA